MHHHVGVGPIEADAERARGAHDADLPSREAVLNLGPPDLRVARGRSPPGVQPSSTWPFSPPPCLALPRKRGHDGRQGGQPLVPVLLAADASTARRMFGRLKPATSTWGATSPSSSTTPLRTSGVAVAANAAIGGLPEAPSPRPARRERRRQATVVGAKIVAHSETQCASSITQRDTRSWRNT
jgi:hypothetical protein